MPGTQFRLLFLPALAASCLFAAPPLTTIQDTVYKADGSRFTGLLEIEWKTFRTADGSEIPQNTISLHISNGQLSVSLVPTTNALRPLSYTARYTIEGRTQQFTEYWSVPPSTVPLRLREVRTNGPVASPLTNSPLATIAVQDVGGLRTELDIRPTRGPSYQPGRAAVLGFSGGIEGAIGNPGDCVRVDGSAGPCGTGGLVFVDAETPLGVMDGANRTFTLSAAPSPAGSLVLYRNGMLLKQGTAYTLTDNTITFSALDTPRSGDLLAAWYRIDSGSTVTIDIAPMETPAGTLNGTNRVFTLSAAPVPAASLQLYRNGLLQKAGTDYTLAVNTITFLPASTPRAGDLLQATYRK
jgi:hypothetical protein